MTSIPSVTAGDGHESAAKAKVRKKLRKVFRKMACKNVKHAIHGTAISAAAIVAILPIGMDAWALRLAEIYMLLSIYSHYGIELSESAAESLLTAAFAQAAGELAAFAALEAADVAAVATAGASYLICYGIAAGLIETIGWLTVRKLEGSKAAKAVISSMEAVGAVADVMRVESAIGAALTDGDAIGRVSAHGHEVSFCGSYAGSTESQWLNAAFAASNETSSVNYASNVRNCIKNAAMASLGPEATQAEINAYVNPIYQNMVR